MRRLIASILMSALAIGIGAETINVNLKEGSYSEGQVFYAFSQNAQLFFRFEGGSFFRLDRPLYLAAFPNAERAYAIEIEARSADGQVIESRKLQYLIDSLPPEVPSLDPDGGRFSGDLAVKIDPKPGSKLRYAVISNQDAKVNFIESETGVTVILEAPKDGSRKYRIASYDIDAAGNPSAIKYSDFTVFFGEIPRQGNAQASVASPEANLPSLVDVLSVVINGGTAIMRVIPAAGDQLFASLGEGPGRPDPRAYGQIPTKNGIGEIKVEIPYGMKKEYTLFLASQRGGRILYQEQPIVLSLDATKDIPSLADPESPNVQRASAAGARVVSFKLTGLELYFSYNGAAFIRYTGPFVLPSTLEQTNLSFYTRDSTGEVSRVVNITLSPILPIVAPKVSGLPASSVSQQKVIATVSGPPVIRYELSRGGNPPPEVSASSPLLSGPIELDTEAGSETSFYLRLRGYESTDINAVGSDEISFGFLVDKKPPEQPTIAGIEPNSSYESPKEVSFGSPGNRILYRVERTGEVPGVFIEYKGPFVVGEEHTERANYLIRAYSIDSAGNRSVGDLVVKCSIDSDSLYVAENGSDENSGSADKPFKSLDAAIKAAKSLSRRFVYIRGVTSLSISLSIDSPLSILGGYDSSWMETADGYATVIVQGNLSEPVFSHSKGNLVMRRLRFSADTLSGPLVKLTGGALFAKNCSIEITRLYADSVLDLKSSQADLSGLNVKVSARAAKTELIRARGMGLFHMADCDIQASGSGIASIIASYQNSLAIERCQLRSLGGFSRVMILALEGGSVDASDSLLSSTKDPRYATGIYSMACAIKIVRSYIELGSTDGSVAASLSGGSLFAENCAIVAKEDAESSFYYGIMLDQAEAKVYVCHMNLSRARDTIAVVARGSKIDLLFDTVLLNPSGNSATALQLNEGSGRVINCIFAQISGIKGTAISRQAGAFNYQIASCLISGFERLVTAQDDGVEAALRASTMSEDFSKTFQSVDKNSFQLRLDSRCVGTGRPVEDGPDKDWSGRAIPAVKDGRRPDIGADQVK